MAQDHIRQIRRFRGDLFPEPVHIIDQILPAFVIPEVSVDWRVSAMSEISMPDRQIAGLRECISDSVLTVDMFCHSVDQLHDSTDLSFRDPFSGFQGLTGNGSICKLNTF